MDALPTVPAPVDAGDKTLAILCHVSFFLGVGFILPLIVYLVKRNDSGFVAAHAREVLNFHISLLIYFICACPLILVLVGFFIWMALALLAFVCAIVAAIRAGEGGFFVYPLTIRFIS